MANVESNNDERPHSREILNIGSRLELFVDGLLIGELNGTSLRMHRPHKMPRSETSFTGDYMTVIKDGEIYKGYYRIEEIYHYVESEDGISWERPDLGIRQGAGGRKNAILESHNFAPFRDSRIGIPKSERYKALGSDSLNKPRSKETRGRNAYNLYAYASADGIFWRKMSDEPVMKYDEELHGSLAFDSQNTSFWSEQEQRYVLFFRHYKAPGELRTIGRATSEDFLNWTDESASFEVPNLPGELLYSSQTHPYFRAPHIYIALPTRYTWGEIKGEAVSPPKNIGSTDILFMTTRAGASSYERLFKGAFIPPGLDPEGWINRAGYVALNVVPTGASEMSIYHKNGFRYVLRTDGFASVNAPYSGGEFTTKPFIFEGKELVLNLSTSIRGGVRVELQTPEGEPLPGFSLDDCKPVIDDSVERVVAWSGGSDLSALAGEPVRLRFEMKDSDLFSLRFR